MAKQAVVYPYPRILLRKRKERELTTDTSRNMDRPLGHCAE